VRLSPSSSFSLTLEKKKKKTHDDDDNDETDSSTVGPAKSAKFRVEFSSHTSLSSNSPLLSNTASFSSNGSAPNSPNPDSKLYPTVVTLVMEKGAHSTFKASYNRLRQMWE
jgi:hypothetical protein